jgi:hypothetical protein
MVSLFVSLLLTAFNEPLFGTLIANQEKKRRSLDFQAGVAWGERVSSTLSLSAKKREGKNGYLLGGKGVDFRLWKGYLTPFPTPRAHIPCQGLF